MNEITAHHHGLLREQLRLEREYYVKQMEDSLKQLAEDMAAKYVVEMEQALSNQKTHYQLELARAQARLVGVEGMVDAVASSGNAYTYYSGAV